MRRVAIRNTNVGDDCGVFRVLASHGRVDLVPSPRASLAGSWGDASAGTCLEMNLCLREDFEDELYANIVLRCWRWAAVFVYVRHTHSPDSVHPMG